MEEKDFLLANQLCFATYNLSRTFVNQYETILKPYHLTYPQYIVMMALWEDPVQSVKQLGERLHLDSGTLSPMLKRMEQHGHITRRRNPKDERQVLVEMTAHAHNYQAAVQQDITDCFARLNMSEADYLQLLNDLKTANNTLGGLKHDK